MLNANQMPSDYLKTVKRHLNITWSDSDTDKKVIDVMLDAEAELNHILGAEIDYFVPGMERRLYLNYCLYAWNDCLNEFEDAYRKEIIRIRHKHRIKGGSDNEEQVPKV